MKKLIATLFCILLLPSLLVSGDKGAILVMRIQGVINPVTSEYIDMGIREAQKIGAQAILIEMDTPGGLLEATRTTIGAMVNTTIPVIVYVSPRGSRATSAGVFITMASDIAAMAPETHIGAAHPVNIGGGTPKKPTLPQSEDDKKDSKEDKTPKMEAPEQGSVMEEKMVSDAAAYIRALAKERGRNAKWAEQAVRESVSLTAEEAVQKKVVEVLALNREDLFKKISGKKIMKNDTETILELVGAPIHEYEMSDRLKFFHRLAHPNLAYMLMTLGFWALVYELTSPGFGLGGIVGVICFLLAFFSFQVLPVNTVGLILLVFGLLLMLVDLFTPTYGLLTGGGLVSFALGSFMLIDAPPDLPQLRVSLYLILPTVILTGLLFTVAIRKAIKAWRRKPNVGEETLAGSVGEVRQKIDGEGMVFINGELWKAKSDEKIKKGEKVIVVSHEGNTLIVKKSKNS
jgi:membrane-bound serine protease (ClpP class)